MSYAGEFEAVMRLAQLGQFSEAISLCREVLRNNEGHASAWHLLGACLLKLGEPKEAAASICKAVELEPCIASYRSNLGAAELELGNFKSAVQFLRDAVYLQPEQPEYKLHLAAGLCRTAEFKEALDLLNKVPASTNVSQRKAEVLLAMGRFREAADAYRSVASAQPSNWVAWHGLGNAQISDHDYDAAVATLTLAKRAAPASTKVSLALANALERSGEPEAVAFELASLRCREPDNFALQLRAAMYLPEVFDDRESAVAAQLQATKRVRECFEKPGHLDFRTVVQTGCCPPYHLTHLGTDNRGFREAISTGLSSQIPVLPLNPFSQHRPRIGFVVTRGHEGIFLRGFGKFVRSLDRDRLERRIFCDPRRLELIAEKTESNAGECIPLLGNLPDMTRSIASARCDMLYYWEIATDTTNFFLAQHRLAPHQCTSIGVQETSGMATIDAYLSSRLLDAPGDQVKFTEHLVCLDAIPHFVQRPHGPADPAIKTRLGLPDSRHIYLCNQNPLKIQPAMDLIFAEILRRDPLGIVVVTGGLASGLRRRMQERHRRKIADVVDRIHWTTWLSDEDFNSLTAAAEVVIDTSPMAGSSTSYTTLGLGTPIVTIQGELSRGRMTAACYQQMGIENLICASTAEYVSTAVSVATDSGYRSHLHRMIQDRSARLFDHTTAIEELQRYFENFAAIPHS